MRSQAKKLTHPLAFGLGVVILAGLISFKWFESKVQNHAEARLADQSAYVLSRIQDTAAAVKAWGLMVADAENTELESGGWIGATRVRLFKNRVRLDLSSTVKAASGWAAEFDSAGSVKNDPSPVPEDLFEVASKAPFQVQTVIGPENASLARWIFPITTADGKVTGGLVVDTKLEALQVHLTNSLPLSVLLVDSRGRVILQSGADATGLGAKSLEDLSHLDPVKAELSRDAGTLLTYKPFPGYSPLLAYVMRTQLPEGRLITQVSVTALGAEMAGAKQLAFGIMALVAGCGFAAYRFSLRTAGPARKISKPAPVAKTSESPLPTAKATAAPAVTPHLSPEPVEPLPAHSNIRHIFSKINRAKSG